MNASRSLTLGALAAALLLVASLLATSPAQARTGGSGVLTANGRVGDLYTGKSTLADIRRFAGTPTKRSTGRGEGGETFTSLEYRCGRGKHSAYFLDEHGRLSNFTTNCRGWRTAGGTRVGMSRDEAEEHEGEKASFSCGSGKSIRERGRRGAALFVTFLKTDGLVRALAVAGRNSVLGC